MVNAAITLEKGKPNSVFDNDGSAVVIHAKADDYKSDPAGNAGDRIACGVIQQSGSDGRRRAGAAAELASADAYAASPRQSDKPQRGISAQ